MNCLPRALRAAGAAGFFALLLCHAAGALAGTTGTLSGTVTDATTRAPLANAKVSVASPSQSASVTTDSSGHFAFLALAPDTYTVVVALPGYDAATVTGETVIADQNDHARRRRSQGVEDDWPRGVAGRK